jgi:hypothetical protein
MLRMITHLLQLLKPTISMVLAVLRPDGTLEATIRLPDGRTTTVLFVDLDEESGPNQHVPAAPEEADEDGSRIMSRSHN